MHHCAEGNVSKHVSYPVTSVAMGHDGTTVYSGGVDNVIRRWDLRMLNAQDLPTESLSLQEQGT